MVKSGSLAVLAAGAVLAAALAHCGPDASAVAYLRTDHCPVGGCVDAGSGPDTGPATIPDEPLEDWDTTGAGPLTGIFIVEATIDATVVVPVQLRQLLRLRIVQKGKSVHQKTTLCAFKLPVVQDVATLEIPPALQSLIQTKTSESTGDYLSSDSILGASYQPPPFLVLVGAALKNPATDPLPTQDDLTGAIDEDSDGHPGVSLLATVLTCTQPQDLFVALRTSGILSGTVLTPDVIEGKLNVHLDESILGYDDPCLATAATIKIDIHPGSPYRAERTDASDDIDGNGNVSCAEMLLDAPKHFPDWVE